MLIKCLWHIGKKMLIDLKYGNGDKHSLILLCETGFKMFHKRKIP